VKLGVGDVEKAVKAVDEMERLKFRRAFVGDRDVSLIVGEVARGRVMVVLLVVTSRLNTGDDLREATTTCVVFLAE